MQEVARRAVEEIQFGDQVANAAAFVFADRFQDGLERPGKGLLVQDTEGDVFAELVEQAGGIRLQPLFGDAAMAEQAMLKAELVEIVLGGALAEGGEPARQGRVVAVERLVNQLVIAGEAADHVLGHVACHLLQLVVTGCNPRILLVSLLRGAGIVLHCIPLRGPPDWSGLLVDRPVKALRENVAGKYQHSVKRGRLGRTTVNAC
ncbi:hypothetical protein D3C72_1739390 [compost metagenome]